MGTTMTTRTATTPVRLHREAATALLNEARRDFENAAHELYLVNDEGQRPTIEATVEVIGRLSGVLKHWPQKRNADLGFDEEVWALDFDLSLTVLEWLESVRDQHAGFVAELDDGRTDSGDEQGYIASQVYLLHVLDGILAQRDEAAQNG